MKPDAAAIERLVRAALDEDAPWGDITSQYLLPEDAAVTARLVAREPGVFCGEDLFRAAMSMTDAAISTRFFFSDGAPFIAKDILAEASGPARSVLQAERVALNFVQRLCGIATMTASFVAQTTGTKAQIVDTRKTTPNLRLLDRYAVRCGGGRNHRYSLSDAVLVKDNHLAVLAAHSGTSVTESLIAMRAQLPHTISIEVEVDSAAQIEEVLAASVDTILLDNFSIAELTSAVEQIAGRAVVEASGGVSLDTVRDIALTGVDIISVGALTHSVRSLDLGLDIEHSPSN
jgi:nicotinate-nucleotide pyrophosphorylase (carboxylating)